MAIFSTDKALLATGFEPELSPFSSQNISENDNSSKTQQHVKKQ